MIIMVIIYNEFVITIYVITTKHKLCYLVPQIIWVRCLKVQLTFVKDIKYNIFLHAYCQNILVNFEIAIEIRKMGFRSRLHGLSIWHICWRKTSLPEASSTCFLWSYLCTIIINLNLFISFYFKKVSSKCMYTVYNLQKKNMYNPEILHTIKKGSKFKDF